MYRFVDFDSGKRTFLLDEKERTEVIADAYKHLADHRIGSCVSPDDLDLLITCEEHALNREGNDPWKPMLTTDLYTKDLAAYCELLEFIPTHEHIRRIQKAVD